MASNRIKKELSSKQANKASLIISGLYFICMLIKGLIFRPVGDDALYFWMIGGFAGTALIYLFLYYFIFKVYDKEMAERDQQIKGKIEQFLSTTDYKQVYFLYESCDRMDMIMQILQKEGCKFYAKLTENNNIHLIVKDKHNEEVYSVEIENLFYFTANFKFDE